MGEKWKKSPIEMVFFDVGGVLLFDFIETKTADLAKKYGIDTERLIRCKDERRPQADCGLIDDGDFWQLILRDCGIQAAAEDLLWSSYLEILPDGFQLARDLRGTSCRIGILSNDSREMWAEKSRRYAFADLFHPIVISSQHGTIKPEPELYRIALEQAGCPAERCVFIDDRQANIQTAQQLGMAAVLVTGIAEVRLELIRLGVEIRPPSL